MSVRINRASLDALLADYAEKKAVELGDQFVGDARGRSSRRTGRLADSIEAGAPEHERHAVRVTIEVGEEYGRYQDEGTGIFGPHGERITATRPGGVLVFDWPAAGGTVFARSTAGAPGTHFWSLTVDDWSNIVRAVAA